MELDEQLPDLLRRAVGTLEPAAAPLVAGGLARGRRLRRRLYVTRTAEGLGAAAVVAAVVAVVVAAVPSGSSSPHAVPAGSGNHGAALGAPSAPASSSPSAPKTTTVTPAQLRRTAISLLPRSGHIAQPSGEHLDGFVGTQFVYDDGHGAAAISVSLDYPPAGGGLGSSCQIAHCTTRSDGTTLAVYLGNGHPGHPSIPGTERDVQLLRADGVVVDVTEWNAASEKDARQTRPEPPFTVAELTAIVASPKFTVTMPA